MTIKKWVEKSFEFFWRRRMQVFSSNVLSSFHRNTYKCYFLYLLSHLQYKCFHKKDYYKTNNDRSTHATFSQLISLSKEILFKSVLGHCESPILTFLRLMLSLRKYLVSHFLSVCDFLISYLFFWHFLTQTVLKNTHIMQNLKKSYDRRQIFNLLYWEKKL